MRAGELELELDAPQLPSTPSPAQLQQLRDSLAGAVRTGDIALRKALHTALVANITVHDFDDIRPTYRLYDPEQAAAVRTVGDTAQRG